MAASASVTRALARGRAGRRVTRMARRHCSVWRTWLKVKRWTPATARRDSQGRAGPFKEAAGLSACARRSMPGVARGIAPTLRRLFVAIFTSLARSTGPARPKKSGRVTPRARTRWIQRPTRAGRSTGCSPCRSRSGAVPHRLDRDVVRDLGVAFRVAGDADAGERPAHLVSGARGAEALSKRPRGRWRRRRARRRPQRPPRSAGRRSRPGGRGRRPGGRRRAGTTRKPWALSGSASSRVASSPLLGEAVTVTVTSCGTHRDTLLGRRRGQHLVARLARTARATRRP